MAKLRFLQGDRMSGVSNEPQRDGLHRTIQDSIGKRLRRRRRRVLMKKTETSIRGAVAQWLEHLLCKQDVEGSSPFGSKTPSWGGAKPTFGRSRRVVSEANSRRDIPEPTFGRNPRSGMRRLVADSSVNLWGNRGRIAQLVRARP